MGHTPTRAIGLIGLLAVVWIATYWMYEPSEARTTFGERPEELAGDRFLPIDEPSLVPLPDPEPVVRGSVRAQEASGGAAEERRVEVRERVVAPEFEEYTVRERDTFARIAARFYGDASLAGVISRANPLVPPDKLFPGRTVLRIPKDPTNISGVVVAEEVVAESSVEGRPGIEERPAEVTHVITRNDTLWDLARRYFGDGSRWRRIYEANRGVIDDPNRLPVGRTIVIPPRE